MTATPDLEKSQIAELLREQTALLRTLVHQTAPLDLSHLNEAEREQAFQIRLTQITLEDAFRFMADRANLSLDDYTKYVFSKPKTKQTKSCAEIAGQVQT